MVPGLAGMLAEHARDSEAGRPVTLDEPGPPSMLDYFHRGAEVVACDARDSSQPIRDADWLFELGPQHTPGAQWVVLQLRCPGHLGRVQICATRVPRASASGLPGHVREGKLPIWMAKVLP